MSQSLKSKKAALVNNALGVLFGLIKANFFSY
jgi:hypothetical protein